MKAFSDIPNSVLPSRDFSFDPAVDARRRRKTRIAWFIIAEAVALAALVLSIVAGVSERFAAESLTPFFQTVPIAAAIVATIIPIIFFGDPKRRNR